MVLSVLLRNGRNLASNTVQGIASRVSAPIAPLCKYHVMGCGMKRSALLLMLPMFVVTVVIISVTVYQVNNVCAELEQKAKQCYQRSSAEVADSKASFVNVENNSPVDFTGFDNKTGVPDGCYIVPNIVHFIRFTAEPVSYVHMICYLAAFRNQRPDKIIFHYDDVKTFSGQYWDILSETPNFLGIVDFHYVEMPTEIYGQEIAEDWRKFHGSDISRLRILMQYGGIFLDNDSYLIRSLNDYRRYEIAIGWDGGDQFLGTQVMVAHKDARFLKLWLESYRNHYKADEWYYNAGERPTVEILYKQPELVHQVKYLFGVHNGFIVNIFAQYWPQWRYMYTMHLLHRHMYMLGEDSHLPTVYDEKNVLRQGNTFREMALDVYNPENLSFKYEEEARNDGDKEEVNHLASDILLTVFKQNFNNETM